MFHFLHVRRAHNHAPSSRASAVMISMLLAACASVQAQTDVRLTRTDPLDPKASVPAVLYESSLTASKPTPDDRPSWRQANDTVTRIGGWRAYAREAQHSDAPAAVPPTSTSSPPGHSPKEMGKPMHHGHGAHKSP